MPATQPAQLLSVTAEKAPAAVAAEYAPPVQPPHTAEEAAPIAAEYVSAGHAVQASPAIATTVVA